MIKKLFFGFTLGLFLAFQWYLINEWRKSEAKYLDLFQTLKECQGSERR
jgi:hypothetical protein